MTPPPSARVPKADIPGIQLALDEQHGRIETLVERVGDLYHKIDNITSAIVDLKTVIAAAQAQNPPSFSTSLNIVRDLVILIGAAVSGVIFIATSQTTGRQNLIEYRMEQMERRHNEAKTWSPTTEEIRPERDRERSPLISR